MLDSTHKKKMFKQYLKIAWLSACINKIHSLHLLVHINIRNSRTRNKICSKLKRKTTEQGQLIVSLCVLTLYLRWLLCNALIQPHFDYTYTVWYPNLNKKLKNNIQSTQNKYIRFCLNLDKIAHISQNKFKKLNWLPISDRVTVFPQISMPSTY